MQKNEMNIGRVRKISGPLIVADGMRDVEMYEVVRVGENRLIGEVIELRGDRASIQVYEQTAGLGVGAPVYPTGAPLSVELAPGLIESIADGIQRPLSVMYESEGDRITPGLDYPSLDHEKLWFFEPKAKIGDLLEGGDVLGVVQETEAITHRIMVPPYVKGRLTSLARGMHTIVDTIAVLETEDGEKLELPMLQRWPVRRGRPVREKLVPKEPLVTGQRVIDTLFPIAKGGVAAIPGPFGSGKTVVQHQLAKWANADIIVYIGCGERGNEMTDVLLEFPELNDPRTGLPLMKRTTLIANTSDMPVAAREASIYTGIAIAEYFRDMGYDVAIMADSTSRWAEALREMSGRLEEMPGEEGYPAYLSARLAEFYERAGTVRCLGGDDRYGSVTAIGAVSPPGGDTSEPVSQATLRIVKVFWGLSAQLAYQRHFPAIDWLRSYSLYATSLQGYFDREVSQYWSGQVQQTMALLQRESELNEIVRLVGVDALSEKDQLALECARSIREDFLHQNAFDDIDTYTSPTKQAGMMRIILSWYRHGIESLEMGIPYQKVVTMPSRDRIGRMKEIRESDWAKNYRQIRDQVHKEYEELQNGGQSDAQGI